MIQIIGLAAALETRAATEARADAAHTARVAAAAAHQTKRNEAGAAAETAAAPAAKKKKKLLRLPQRT